MEGRIVQQNADLGSLAEDGNLLQRRLGEKAFLTLKKELRKLPKGGILLLDFRRVKHATSTCLFEILRIFDEARNAEYEGKYLLLRLDLRNEDFVDCLSLAIKERGIVLPAIDRKGRWMLLGELSKALRETLELVREREEVTSGQVGGYFNIPISAASNRLKQLYQLRLISRKEETISESGGWQFIYTPLPDLSQIEVHI